MATSYHFPMNWESGRSRETERREETGQSEGMRKSGERTERGDEGEKRRKQQERKYEEGD